MRRVVIADDESVIVRGLKKLIDWNAFQVEIVGEAHNGEQLMRCIEETDPDLVVTDIRMPGSSGLEVLQWNRERGGRAKFIFISAYQEFSYAQEAIKNGAVDYLIKPVGRRELEEAVRKAMQILDEQDTVEIFKPEKDEFRKLFEDINNRRNYENEDLYQMFREENIDLDNRFYVGISAGIHPDIAAKMNEKSFGQFNLVRFSVFNRLSEAFGSRKLGFIVKKNEECIFIMGVFPNEDREVFVEKYIEPIREQVGRDIETEVCMGIGTAVDEPSGMLQSYKESEFAFGLHHFEEAKIIDAANIHREYHVSFEDYKEDVELAFRAIIAKDSRVLERIDRIMEDIESIHYGNWDAVIMRTMTFSGDLDAKLDQYHLLDMDFYKMQNDFQKIVYAQHTMNDLKKCVHDHYRNLIRRVYAKGRSEDKVMIEDVKRYIRQNYAKDLSIKELAEVACVSQNYFSAMFKKETGQNYKAYLTSIRMEEALRLLRETDYKTYEIGEKVGYNNVRRFVDAFKQIYSVSPMEYKKGLKGK
ncbi:MAG: response regulator [Clostridiales bacterium]|nr:response regulator [Clostridiales bacterium]